MKIIITLLIIFTLLGCQDKSSTGAKTPEKHLQSAMTPATPAAISHVSIAGTVLEKIDVTGGMYLRLKTPKGDVWAAVDKADVKKGAEVRVVNAIPMDGFESKALKRKFDHIFFGSLATGSDTATVHAPMATGHMAPDSKQEMITKMHPAVANLPAEKGAIKVKKAEGPEGKTVSEIFAAQAALKDAPVAMHGKIVKCNTGIMGKNWLHIRDGSGSPEKNDFDITVTTTDSSANVGDVVLVRGTVRINRDFGAGYAYPVIIEDAKISK